MAIPRTIERQLQNNENINISSNQTKISYTEENQNIIIASVLSIIGFLVIIFAIVIFIRKKIN